MRAGACMLMCTCRDQRSMSVVWRCLTNALHLISGDRVFHGNLRLTRLTGQGVSGILLPLSLGWNYRGHSHAQLSVCMLGIETQVTGLHCRLYPPSHLAHLESIEFG